MPVRWVNKTLQDQLKPLCRIFWTHCGPLVHCRSNKTPCSRLWQTNQLLSLSFLPLVGKNSIFSALWFFTSITLLYYPIKWILQLRRALWHSAHDAVLPWKSAYRVFTESCPPCLTPFSRKVLPSQCSVDGWELDLPPIKTAAVIAISIMQNLPPASGLTRSGGPLPTACVSYSCIFHTLHNDVFQPSATCGCFLGPTHQYVASLQGHSNKNSSPSSSCRKVKVEVSRSCE